jgi:hypothetical protein
LIKLAFILSEFEAINLNRTYAAGPPRRLLRSVNAALSE